MGPLFSGPPQYNRDRFVEAVRRIFPDVQPEELVYDSCGIRPKLRGPTENEERDFIVSEDRRGFINLVGIESPGLTASLALADLVAEKLGV